jgi:hypothetical protein
MSFVTIYDSNNRIQAKCATKLLVELLNNCQRGGQQCQTFYRRAKSQIQKSRKCDALGKKIALQALQRLYEQVRHLTAQGQRNGGLWVKQDGLHKRWIALK